ncbi:glycine cleavage system aminomethyltransferase GcvT [Clostridium coskatii]|uniref:Aminomethyltransferase n=1 Tax=Clostridium coskatii TaxID=1705578 RepID=A0A168N500_9CLOT|nr:glycine cleavage system aminomethyltransferase GcvT [Clostridium coskatii]OAA85777.1 Aminomethyltransferase [Clostridium coskatii]OBR91938.1 aminomethyltransferase [Clostridium coskatii]
MEELKKTPLFDSYKKYGAKIIDFAGWDMPVQFEGITAEHQAVRKKAGLFDVSHMGEADITGKDALEFVQNLITNDAAKIKENQILYTPMCYPEGGIVDDILVYKFTNEHFFLVINAANTDKDIDWMKKNKGNFQVDIKNISPSIIQLAIQGPNAQKILQKLTDTDLNSIKFYFFKKDVLVAGKKCMVSRTGYTGEDGFEIYSENENAEYLWDKILEKGKEDGIKPVGLGARDTLRFEVSLPLYGNELSKSITPLEAGIGIFVKLDKDNFIGKDALVKQKKEGLKRKIVGFEMKERGISRHGYEVFAENKKIGEVTTGYRSPSLNKNIGFALINSKYAPVGTSISIKVRNKLLKAEVVSKKFYNKNYNK